jgi:hypothetical protein
VGFDALDPTGRDVDANANAPDAFSTGAFAFMRTIGTTTACDTGQLAIPVDAPLPAGTTVVVRVGLRSAIAATPVSATDDAGNVYSLDASHVRVATNQDPQLSLAVLSATLDRPLAPPQFIAISAPVSQVAGVVVDAFEGVAASARVAAAAGSEGGGTILDSPVVTSEDGLLLYCALAKFNAGIVVENSWSTTTNIRSDCGGATNESDLHGGVQAAGLSGTHSCAAMLDVSALWVMTVIAYRD